MSERVPPRPPVGQDYTVRYFGPGNGTRARTRPIGESTTWPPPPRLLYDNGDYDLSRYTQTEAIYVWHSRRPEHG